jgi:hypothetical protein
MVPSHLSIRTFVINPASHGDRDSIKNRIIMLSHMLYSYAKYEYLGDQCLSSSISMAQRILENNVGIFGSRIYIVNI